VYVLNSKGRKAGPLDTRRAEKLVSSVVMVLVPLAAVVHFLVVVAAGA
jgi:adenosylcobinamide-phosphate synthase